jgi:hypothetical protein
MKRPRDLSEAVDDRLVETIKERVKTLPHPDSHLVRFSHQSQKIARSWISASGCIQLSGSLALNMSGLLSGSFEVCFLSFRGGLIPQGHALDLHQWKLHFRLSYWSRFAL